MKSNTLYIGIDPGAKGAICTYFKLTESSADEINTYSMPATFTDRKEFFQDLRKKYPNSTMIAYLENTGTYRPGNSAVAACTFAKLIGSTIQVLVDFEIPTTLVTPQKWMKAFGCPNALEKAERKRWIKTKAQQLYPKLKLTLVNADAVGLLHTNLFIF